MITFKGRHTPKPIILQCVRWYCSYALNYRNIEEMMAEHGLKIDHGTLNRWIAHYAPKLEKAFHKKKKRPGDRWRLDETYIKVKGKWKYYYRAVNKQGNTIDFLLTAKRDTKAALRFLNKAIGRNGKPGLVNIDKSGANKAGINQFNKDSNRRVKIRQCKYLNNIVEQDHRPFSVDELFATELAMFGTGRDRWLQPMSHHPNNQIFHADYRFYFRSFYYSQ